MENIFSNLQNVYCCKIGQKLILKKLLKATFFSSVYMYVVVILSTAKKNLVIALNFFGTKKKRWRKKPLKNITSCISSVKSFQNLKKRKSFFIQGCVSFTKKLTLRNFRDNEKRKKKRLLHKKFGGKIGSDNVQCFFLSYCFTK